MEPSGAKIILTWNDGRSVEIGTIEMKSEEKGTRIATKVRVRRKRIGWEFVRLGMRIMFPGRSGSKNDGAGTDEVDSGS